MTLDETVHTTLPLTAAQRTIWFDEFLSEGDEVLHTMADVLDFTGPVDVPRLLVVLRQLLDEAEALRVRFEEEDGLPVQRLVEAGDTVIPVLTPEGIDASERLAWAHREVQKQAQCRIGSSGGPLVRMSVIPVADDRTLLVLVAHHAVLDGYSRVPLYRRLAELYRGNEGAPALPPLTTLLDAEKSYEQSIAAGSDGAYWHRTAPILPAPFRLAAGSITPGRRHQRSSLRISTTDADAARVAAERTGSTPSTFLIGAVGLAFARLSERSAGTVTLPVAARVGADARATPGMVANYVPLGIDVHGTVRDYLAGLGRSVMRTLRHQRHRGEIIARHVEASIEERAPFGPFVNVLPQDPVLDFGNVVARLHNVSTGIVDDLNVTLLVEEDGAIGVHVNGNPDRYGAVALARCAEAVAASIRQLATSDPDGPIPEQLDGLDESTRRDALEQGEQTPTAEDAIDAIDRHYRATPDAVAIIDGSHRLSYRQMIDAARDLARSARAGDVVAIVAEPGAAFVVSVLGALLARAAWLPIDVTWPRTRISTLLDDARATRIWGDEVGAAIARAVGAADRLDELVPLVDRALRGPDRPVERLPRAASTDIAYVLYTSGTTGRPKGAMVHRGGMANHLLSKINLLELTASDVVVQNAPVTFDVSIWQMLAPLMVGGTTRPSGRADAGDPDALARIVASDGVTVLEVVPSLLRVALKLWQRDERAPVRGVRSLMVTGEALNADLARSWTRFAPEIPLINAYGPTECSDDVAHAVIRAVDDDVHGMPIGRPTPNTRLSILDAQLRPAVIGEPGELYVSGHCVGAGYLQDPAKTSTTFIASPYGDGVRMYRTGDVVRWREDGQLEFLERLDFQIKVNGQRVELGEIEATLRAIDEIHDAVVTAEKNASGGTRLRAFVTATDGREVHKIGLRERLGAHLPAHMVPASITVLDELPLTAHGKIDRKALTVLPEPAGADPAAAPAVAITDRTQTEAMEATIVDLVAAFTDVLAVEAGSDTDFFRAGGDSIGAIQLVSRSRDRGLEITVRQVFAERTPAALAVCATRAGDGDSHVAPVSTFVATGVLPATPIALQLARDAGSLVPAARGYAQWMRFRTPEGITTDAVSALIEGLRTAHPVLGSVVEEHADGVWLQRVGSTTPWPVEETRGERAEAVAERLGSRLDPSTGIVGAAALVDGMDARELVLVLHHLCVDGVSWRVLRDDLEAGWSSWRSGGPVVVEAEPVGFEEWAVTQQRVAASGVLVASEFEIWDARRSDAPARLDGTSDISGTAEEAVIELDADLTAMVLRAGAERYGADVTDLMLAALSRALVMTPAVAKVVGSLGAVEVEGHGREDIEADRLLDLSRTVGWFTTAYPVLLTASQALTGLGTVADAVRAVELIAESRRRMSGHGIGFGMLSELDPRTIRAFGAADRPLLGFNYLGRFTSREPGGAFMILGDNRSGPVRTIEPDALPLRHALSITAAVGETADGPRLTATWRFAPRLLAAQSVASAAAAWVEALRILCQPSGALDAETSRAGRARGAAHVDVDASELDALTSRFGPIEALLPTTPAQRGMLFHATQAGGHDPYLISVEAELSGITEAERLACSVRAVVAAHPSLSSRFARLNDGRVIAVRTRPAVEPDVSIEAEHETTGTSTVDPWDGSVLVCRIAPTAGGFLRMRWLMHHAVIDGWSLGVLFAEVLEHYRTGVLPVADRAFDDHLSRIADTTEAEQRWARRLDGARACRAFALDPARLTGLAHRRLRVEVDAATTARLRRTASDAGVTEAVLVDVVWASMLAAVTGRPDVLFGRVVSGRSGAIAHVEHGVGPFLATVPARVTALHSETLPELLRRVQADRAEAWEDDQIDLARTVAAVPSLAGQGEVFDTAVIFQNVPVFAADAESGVVRFRAEDSRHYPLSASVTPGECLVMVLDHDSAYLDETEALVVRDLLLAGFAALADGHVPTGVIDALASSSAGNSVPPVRSDARSATRTAASEEEAAVVSAFERVLGLDRIGIDDDFFEAGGDSIAAIAVVEDLRGAGYLLFPRDVFERRSPARIAPAARSIERVTVLDERPSVTFDADDLDEELGLA